MYRVKAESDVCALEVTAFDGDEGRTVVLLNRGCQALSCELPSPKGGYRWMETTSQYYENHVTDAPRPCSDSGLTTVVVEPGAIVTLTTVPLGEVPAGFEMYEHSE
jgi:hypothetical protein